MKFLSDLRSLALLRRIALASERQASAMEKMAEVAVDEWSRKHSRPKPSPVEFGTMDVSEVEKLYARRKEAEELGQDLDEDQL